VWWSISSFISHFTHRLADIPAAALTHRPCLWTQELNYHMIRKRLTRKSKNIVYCISCRRCPQLYIGEIGRTLHERFGEHLRSVKKNTGGFPVAEHFNSPGHSLSDIAVRGLRRCSGASFRRRQLESRACRLGTMQADGLNNVFHFL